MQREGSSPEEICAEWPASARKFLLASYGEPLSVETLRGLSRGRIWRINFARCSLVIKRTAHPRELSFYERVAPTLDAIGLCTPKLEWSGQDGQASWLAIENIPTPLPRTRWYADTELLATLRSLHDYSIGLTPPLADAFRPQWTDALTEAALTTFPTEIARRCRSTLLSLQARSQPLFSPSCWISGDPNPTNWGLRNNGALTLYDWERFGLGTPALDLAITVPWLGDKNIFETVASRYLSASGDVSVVPSSNVARLAEEIAMAKIWSVIEFLSMHQEGVITNTNTIEELIRDFPDWLKNVAPEAVLRDLF